MAWPEVLETIGVQVSQLNECDYCVDHHAAALRELLGDARHRVVLRALGSGRPQDAFEGRELVAAYFAYANRTVLGLGITTDGDDLGTAPPESDDVTDWRHG